MQEERLKILLEYLQEEPNEPFNIYALALEYLKHDVHKAKSLFERLLLEFPDYVATYYHAAALFVDLGDFDKAEMIYLKGIEKAHQAQSMKAYDELKRPYRMLQDEMD